MSDEKNKVSDKASEIAKNIWLAGVGAYGKAVDEAQGRLEKAMEPPKLFKELVKAGSALEEEATKAIESRTITRSSVEERINKVRENFHNQRLARIEDVAALHKKVDQLTRKVDRLARALAEEGKVKKARGTKAAPKTKSAAGTTSKKKAAAGKKSTTRAKAATRSRSTSSKRKA